MLAYENTIETFIPQRAPFVMIEKLLSVDDTTTITELTITSANIFCMKGRFSESGLVENIAQTAAARVGYLSMQADTPPPIGFIASIKDLKIHKLPAENDVIKTEVAITNQVMDFTIVLGKVFLKGEVIAECEMRILIQKN